MFAFCVFFAFLCVQDLFVKKKQTALIPSFILLLMSKKDQVIIKSKCTKQKHQVFSNRKIDQNKSLDLTQLKFLGKLFANESMCHENHQLAYKCCRLKSACKIHSTWFYNSTLHIKVIENGTIHKIFHPTGIEKDSEADNLDKYINSISL